MTPCQKLMPKDCIGHCRVPCVRHALLTQWPTQVLGKITDFITTSAQGLSSRIIMIMIFLYHDEDRLESVSSNSTNILAARLLVIERYAQDNNNNVCE